MKKPSGSNCDIIPIQQNDCLARAAALIKGGGVVAIPTESSYGLAVDPFNPGALARLFSIKQRPLDKPVLLLVANYQQLNKLVVRVPDCYHRLMHKHWPGPLTLIFSARPTLPDLVTGSTGTIGIRIPANTTARNLCNLLSGPVTGTSANISGSSPLYQSQSVYDQLGASLDLVMDGGDLGQQKSSTIVACDNNELKLIRAGALPFTDLMLS